ncbi:hypothetical protein CTI12_AA631630 [Artemisia annua]|uniref:Uncharacterized protein n=1 Tax=Artemisia annua TaxID=35608 RepID=A0A2U1K8M6_ARTAN|nr:hypothetical protein CTI12_AA631630 [Artemisia annua]
MNLLNELESASNSSSLKDQIILHVHRETGMLNVCHELLDNVQQRQQLIMELEFLPILPLFENSLAFLRLIRVRDFEKCKPIMKMVTEARDHVDQKFVFLKMLLLFGWSW